MRLFVRFPCSRGAGGLAKKYFCAGLETEKMQNQIILRRSPERGRQETETPFQRLSNSLYGGFGMRNEFDFAPLFRSSIGFDRVFNLLANSQRLQAVETWPPYDIVKTAEDGYRIQMAVAGFAEDDLDITQERNVLVVKAQKAEETNAGEYLHRGIAARGFERRFELADHVRVENASLKNGLLSIELKREIPEAMKPRKIAIGAADPQPAPLQIEVEKQVA
ncbi:molecular chaperone IbpA [Rhizobium hainanense]|uniref:Molecular chaperone IbpA n=2 Tax=Rhizobium hainanense TaxID=52131 RepID=A0A1C3WC78_9HYPH|nr:molecular chaperone IbpA [Rhizobium hainanense]